MGRSTVLICVNEEAELRIDLFLGETEKLKHSLLQLVIGDTDRTTGQLNAVEYKVVSLCTYLFLVGLEVFKTLVHRHGEGVVHSQPFAAFLVVLEEGEFCDPQEVPALGDNVQLLCKLQSQCAENRESYLVLVSNDKCNVALFAAESLEDSFKLALSHELAERAVGSVVNPSYISQTLCAYSTNKLCLLVDLFSCQLVSCALSNDTTYRAAVCDCVCEYAEAAALYDIRDVSDLHTKTSIGLIRAIAVHSLVIGKAGQGRRDINIQYLLVQTLNKALQHLKDVLNVNEAHLKVDLSEFGLSVGTEILVTEAACKLDISVHTRDHKKLLVDLGGLGKRIELAVVYTAGNDIVTCALGSGLYHHRSFNLIEAVLVEVLTCALSHLMAHLKVVL